MHKLTNHAFGQKVCVHVRRILGGIPQRRLSKLKQDLRLESTTPLNQVRTSWKTGNGLKPCKSAIVLLRRDFRRAQRDPWYTSTAATLTEKMPRWCNLPWPVQHVPSKQRLRAPSHHGIFCGILVSNNLSRDAFINPTNLTTAWR